MAWEKKTPRSLANRRSSAKVLMTDPDIAHVVKEIFGARLDYVFACLRLSSPVFALHVELAPEITAR